MPLLCCDVGLVSELRLTAGRVLMDLASRAVSGTSVYANGLKYVEVWAGFVLAHYRTSEHRAALDRYILQRKSSLFWSFICIGDFVRCNALNLYKAAIISFYAI